MNNVLALLLVAVMLSGCSIFRTKPVPPEVKIITEYVAVETYQPPMPQPVQLEDVEWFVITKENLDEKWAEIKKLQGGDVVVFGVTPQAYENMAGNLQEMRRFILQQKEIILYYKKATQLNEDINKDGVVNSTDWALKNQQAVEELTEKD